jgi:hypothetical protein
LIFKGFFVFREVLSPHVPHIELNKEVL